MKIYRVVPFLLLLLLFLPTGKAQATLIPIDPSIIIGGGASSPGVGLNFTGTVTTDNFGNAFADFDNGSGVTFFSLTITITTTFAGQLSCGFLNGQTLFSSCTANGTSVTFFGTGNGFTGIPDGGRFSLTFGTFNPNSTVSFTGAANVPEPGTLTLLGMGLGALAARRKWLKRVSLRV